MKVLHSLPQFVPQEVCLSCDGCCRFKDDASAWRPKVTIDELYHLRAHMPHLAQVIFSKESLDNGGYLRTDPADGGCQCKFFELKTNACRIYAQRPFECRLYPFLLRKKEGRYFISVHLACPHIQDHRYTPVFDEYLEALKIFFEDAAVRKLFGQNAESISDYADYDAEIEDIFEFRLSGPSEDSVLLNKRFLLERAFMEELNSESPFAFNSIFNWKDFFKFNVLVIDGRVCIFAANEIGTFMYLPPLGGHFNGTTVEKCFEYMREKGANGVARIENVPFHLLISFPESDYEHYQKGYEYCYYKEDLIALKGNAYKSKRAALNRFLQNDDHQYRPYDDSMYEECMALYQHWSKQRKEAHKDELYQHFLDENYSVHQRALKYHAALGLIGRVVRVSGKIRAYTFGYPVSNDVFCVLFEVADVDVTGLAVYIFHSFCQDEALAPYKFINVMDDFGLENIREVKMSFRPSILFPLYTVTKRQ